jgi:hypothetical protein
MPSAIDGSAPTAGGAATTVLAGEDHPRVTSASSVYFAELADGGAGASVRAHDPD